jgi:hypothetical protein
MSSFLFMKLTMVLDRARSLAGRSELLWVLAAASVWLFLTAPAPAYFIQNPETGHQIGAAWSLLHFDQWPHADYVSTYGPGRYWISALGLQLFDGSLFGELLSRSVFFVLSLVLMQRLLHTVSGDRVVAWLLFMAAAVALPPSHKYWTALCPAVTLWALYFCSFNPSRMCFPALGAAIGCAALFRPDYGLYSLAAALVMLMPAGPPGGRIRASLAVLAGIGLLLVPWLAWLGTRKDLILLFDDWMRLASGVSSGLSLPHPLLHWQAPGLSAVFLAFVIFPLIGLWRWRTQPHANPGMQRFALAVHVFALVNLIQSSHRADWPHLLQGITPGFISMAIILAASGQRVRPLPLRAGLAILLTLGLLTGRVFHPVTPVLAWQHWSAASLSKAEFAQRHLETSQLGPVARLVARCAPADMPVAFFPFLPQLNYYAERPFAAELPYLAPGFVDAPAHQVRTIAVLEKQKADLLFWNENYAYDGRVERNAVNTHAVLHRHVLEHYNRVGQLGGFSLFLHRSNRSVTAACVASVFTHGIDPQT